MDPHFYEDLTSLQEDLTLSNHENRSPQRLADTQVFQEDLTCLQEDLVGLPMKQSVKEDLVFLKIY